MEQRRQAWHAVLELSKRDQEAVGQKRLRKTLQTRDKHLAAARLPRALVELHEQVEAARRRISAPGTTEAMELREQLVRARAGESLGWLQSASRWNHPGEEEGQTEDQDIKDHIYQRAEDIAEDAEKAGVPPNEAFGKAISFRDLALGVTTPLAMHTEDWLREPGKRGDLPERTKLDRRRVVSDLKEWLITESIPDTVEGITRHVAGRHVTKHLMPSGRSTVRIRTVVSHLSSYWEWLIRRGVISGDNPWRRQAPHKVSKSALGGEDERAFTDTEAAKLLFGPARADLRDFMLVAALTGMRREEIARLTVENCRKGVFAIPKAKSRTGERRVPIHSGLTSLVERRSAGKAPGDFLFHELEPAGKMNDRSDAIGKRFGTYRKSLGVHEQLPGQRRSLVNFHSWRRWFITRALQAGQMQHVVEQVVGHALQGMTLGTYFGGDQERTLRACVEAVALQQPADAAAQS